MIIDRFDRIGEYTDKIANLQNALDFIAAQKSWEPGRYEFEGGYILYQDQMTKAVDDGTYENHDKYMDFQVLLEGENWSTLWNRIEEMEVAVPYDAVKDATRWNGEGAVISLKAGMFVCFYPTDAHKPDRFLPGQEASNYKKYVIKLEIPEKM